MNYYIISGVDGDVYCKKYKSKGALLKEITANESGDTYYGDVSKLKFKTELNGIDELNAHEIIVLYAEVIVPKPKQVVQSFEIE